MGHSTGCQIVQNKAPIPTQNSSCKDKIQFLSAVGTKNGKTDPPPGPTLALLGVGHGHPFGIEGGQIPSHIEVGHLDLAAINHVYNVIDGDAANDTRTSHEKQGDAEDYKIFTQRTNGKELHGKFRDAECLQSCTVQHILKKKAQPTTWLVAVILTSAGIASYAVLKIHIQ